MSIKDQTALRQFEVDITEVVNKTFMRTQNLFDNVDQYILWVAAVAEKDIRGRKKGQLRFELVQREVYAWMGQMDANTKLLIDKMIVLIVIAREREFGTVLKYLFQEHGGWC